jgi:hypothetical protein
MDEPESDIGAKSQGSHQSAGSEIPTEPDGSRMEPVSPAEAGSPGPPLKSVHAAATPGEWPLTFCTTCKVEVRPVGKGQCPDCGRPVKRSHLAQRHPINKRRVAQHRDELTAQFLPSTPVDRQTVEHLAAIYERIEVAKAGTVEWQRLVTTAQTLAKTLEESRPKTPRAERDLTGTTLDDLAARVGRLSSLIELARKSEAGSPDPEPYEAGPAVTAVGAEPGPAPKPEPQLCKYGCGTRCTELKASNYSAWEVLHGLDPEVVKKKDAEATAVMLRQIGRPHPW